MICSKLFLVRSHENNIVGEEDYYILNPRVLRLDYVLRSQNAICYQPSPNVSLLGDFSEEYLSNRVMEGDCPSLEQFTSLEINEQRLKLVKEKINA